MKVSARNQLKGKVKSIREGGVMAEVVVTLSSGEELVSVITVTSLRNLGIVEGKDVMVVIKSTEVMLGVDE